MTEQKPSSRRTAPLSLGQIMRLPSSVDLITAARALRLSRNKAYALAKAGEFPCRVIRINEMYRVPTAELLAVLGIDLATQRAINNPSGANTEVSSDGDK